MLLQFDNTFNKTFSRRRDYLPSKLPDGNDAWNNENDDFFFLAIMAFNEKAQESQMSIIARDSCDSVAKARAQSDCFKLSVLF